MAAKNLTAEVDITVVYKTGFFSRRALTTKNPP